MNSIFAPRMGTVERPYRDASEIKSANKVNGGHFFDPVSMRFFNSRTLNDTYGEKGNIFITSERFEENEDFPRMYTVRFIDEDFKIQDLSKFQQFATIQQAKRFASDIAEFGSVSA